MTDNAMTILEIFEAIETRDAEGFALRCQPEVTFGWPPSLPYGSSTSEPPGGLGEPAPESARLGWLETWEPLQPTPAEKAMDPQVVGVYDDAVVGLWHQRGADPPAGASIPRFSECTGSLMESWPAPKCSTSTQPRSRTFSRRQRGKSW